MVRSICIVDVVDITRSYSGAQFFFLSRFSLDLCCHSPWDGAYFPDQPLWVGIRSLTELVFYLENCYFNIFIVVHRPFAPIASIAYQISAHFSTFRPESTRSRVRVRRTRQLRHRPSSPPPPDSLRFQIPLWATQSYKLNRFK